VTRTIPTLILVSSVLRREGIASFLQGTPYKLVATVVRPGELTNFDFPKESQPLVLVGIDSENRSLDQVAEIIRRLRSLMPNSKIVLIAEADRPFDLPRVLALAPDGYILNLGSRAVLLKALEPIFTNDQSVFVLGRPIATLPNEPGDRSDFDCHGSAVDFRHWSSYGFDKETQRVRLSHRECQVLTCIGRGESNKRIARLCHISEATVKAHLKAILRKTNTQNRNKPLFGQLNMDCRTQL
jgi:two-component system, NarL family, nitrate/nitrite response regulator NarL